MMCFVIQSSQDDYYITWNAFQLIYFRLQDMRYTNELKLENIVYVSIHSQYVKMAYNGIMKLR